MIATRQECPPFVRFSPVSPNVEVDTPVSFSFYNENERRQTCFNAYDAVMTIRPRLVSMNVDTNEDKRYFADPAWHSRSEQSRLNTESAVHIVASLTQWITLWTDGASYSDRVNVSVATETVLRRHTSYQKRG